MNTTHVTRLQVLVAVCFHTHINKHKMIDIIPLRILQLHGKVSKDEFIKSCCNVTQEFPSLINYDFQIGYLGKTGRTSKSKPGHCGVWEMWVWLLAIASHYFSTYENQIHVFIVDHINNPYYIEQYVICLKPLPIEFY